jgi:glycosyltransferase involved in cell wall biosynthesis
MKIIHCPRRFTRNAWGGTETCLLSLAKAQQAAGHKVLIFTSKALDPIASEEIEGITVKRFDYVYPWVGLDNEARLQMDMSGGNLFSLGLFRALLRENDVSIIHSHASKRLGGIVRTAAQIKGIPYVISVHGGLFDIPENIESQRRQQHLRTIEWGKALGAVLGSRRVFDDAAAVFCLSKSEQSQAMAKYTGTRIEYLPNGVDLRRFSVDHSNPNKGVDFRTRWDIPQEAKIILNVGRIDPQKNQLVLIEALHRIRVEEPSAHLLLIGHVTDNDYSIRLNRKIEEIGLKAYVTVIPGIDHDDSDMQTAYATSEVFCLPSIHEPFGIVILEAWAAGLPVVTSKVGGVIDFTNDKQDVLHCVQQDAEGWTKAILDALEPQLKNKLVAASTHRVKTEFDWHHINEKVVNLYGELAA